MEQFSNDNMYIIDLGDVNTAPEIIFELSSILDKDEVKNRRVCLKLGNVDLNQAQLLSIKSLINGIDSTLSCMDTKSVETEKTALSLGIIISNVSAQNTLEVTPAMPYKTAEELKEELQSGNSAAEKEEDNVEEIVEESDIELMDSSQNTVLNQSNINQEDISRENVNQENDNQEGYNQEINNSEISDFEINNQEISESTAGDTVIREESVIVEEQKEKPNEEGSEEPQIVQNSVQSSIKEDVQDELDVIFCSNPVQKSIFEMEQPSEIYEAREDLTDIIVPEAEYTKEDIELESFPSKYIKQTIRSGQVINYEGNIVIIGDCHPGCEITAFGDITVWGILSGIAHAGAGGNRKARVRALKMNAIQLRIANCYSRRPDSLNTVYIEKTNSFTPEEARIINGEIVVFKIND